MSFVSVDLWDTLYTDDAISDGRRKAARRGLIADAFGCSSADIEPAHRDADRLAHRSWYERRRTMGAGDRVALIERYRRHVLDPATRSALVAALEDVGAIDPPRPRSDAAAFLDAVRAHHKVIIISDTGVTPGRVLRRILEADALAPMIDGCVFSDEIGAAKPAPAAFHAARLLSGCDSPSRWHVGDNLDTDIAGALNLHIPALHLAAAACPAHHDSPGYHWVSSLSAAALLIAAA